MAREGHSPAVCFERPAVLLGEEVVVDPFVGYRPPPTSSLKLLCILSLGVHSITIRSTECPCQLLQRTSDSTQPAPELLVAHIL